MNAVSNVNINHKSQALDEYIEVFDEIAEKLCEEELSCPICLEVLNHTLVTECLHRFCESCISQFLSKVENKDDRACPLCRVHIKAVRSLRKDKALDTFIKLFHRKDVSDRHIEGTTTLVKNAARKHNQRTQTIRSTQSLKRKLEQPTYPVISLERASSSSTINSYRSSSHDSTSHEPKDPNIDVPNKYNPKNKKSKQQPQSTTIKPVDYKPSKVSEMTDTTIRDLELIEYYIDFDLIKYPNESVLADLSQPHIRCKGGVDIETIKKLILRMNPQTPSNSNDIHVPSQHRDLCVEDIEILISLLQNNAANHDGGCYVLENEWILGGIKKWLTNNSRHTSSIVLLYRSKLRL